MARHSRPRLKVKCKQCGWQGIRTEFVMHRKPCPQCEGWNTIDRHPGKANMIYCSCGNWVSTYVLNGERRVEPHVTEVNRRGLPRGPVCGEGHQRIDKVKKYVP